MAIPSPSRLERWLVPFAGSRGVPIRVWAVDASAPQTVTLEAEIFGAPPRLVCLGGGEDGLVVVRQTRDTFEDLDGVRVPWEHVGRIERDPHLMRDLVTVELLGRGAIRVAVSNHILIPGNRASAKALCDLARHSADGKASSRGLDTRAAPPVFNLPPRPAIGPA